MDSYRVVSTITVRIVDFVVLGNYKILIVLCYQARTMNTEFQLLTYIQINTLDTNTCKIYIYKNNV